MRPLSQTKPPRGGLWKYTHPISGYKFSSHTLAAIKNSVWEHEESNGYPHTAEETLEDQLCQNHPASCGSGEPRLLQKAANFVGEMVNWAREGFPIASQDVLQQRLDICQSCQYWRGVTGGSLLQGKCRKCGCRGVKLALGSSACPLGKWQPI